MMKVNRYDEKYGSSNNEKLDLNSKMNQETTSLSSFNSELESSEVLKNQYTVEFSTNTQSYCVGLVDMVDSTKISARIGWARTSRYYQLFLNSMSEILKRFGGFVIKNVGDCLVYYFPESAKRHRKYGFMSCLECSLTMIESHDFLCDILFKEGLPPVDFRVSADYGSVIIMKPNGSSILDMIGPPVNMCSKINHFAKKNTTVIGGDLYEMVKDFDDFSFKGVEELSLGFKYSYPIFSLSRKR